MVILPHHFNLSDFTIVIFKRSSRLPLLCNTVWAVVIKWPKKNKKEKTPRRKDNNAPDKVRPFLTRSDWRSFTKHIGHFFPHHELGFGRGSWRRYYPAARSCKQRCFLSPSTPGSRSLPAADSSAPVVPSMCLSEPQRARSDTRAATDNRLLFRMFTIRFPAMLVMR